MIVRFLVRIREKAVSQIVGVFLEPQHRAVGDSNERRAQHGRHADLVSWVDENPQEVCQVADLRGIVESAASRELIRNAGLPKSG